MDNNVNVKKCIGFDENGKRFTCPNDAGTLWTELWCLPCDERRRERLTRQLIELVQGVMRDDSR